MMKRPAVLVLFLAGLLIAAACGVNDPRNGRGRSPEAADPVQAKYLRWLEHKEKAVPELKEAVRDPDWRMRTHALLAMGKSGDRNLIPLVMEILRKDDHLAVRNCAVTALGELGAREAVPYLMVMVRRDGGVDRRRQAAPIVVLQALGKIGDRRAATDLISVLLRGPEPISAAAADALMAIKDPAASRRIIDERAAVERASAGFHAARVLGAAPVPGADAYCIALLGGPDTQTRVAAAEALGKMRSPRAVPPLAAALTDASDILVKQSADALVAVNSPAAVALMLGLFADRREQTFMAAAYVLAGMTVPGIAEQVMARFQNDAAVNRPAAYVLGRKKHAPAVPLVQARLRDVKQSGPDELAEALGWIGDRGSVPLLIEVAKRKGREGSIGAIWSLGQLKAVEAVPALLELLGKEDPRLMQHIIAALGSIGDRRAVKSLIDLLYETGERHARAIGNALGKIGGPEVAAFVKDNMDSGDPARVMASGNALVKLRDPALVPYALSLLEQKDGKVRRYAIYFLQKNTGKNLTTEQEWKDWAARNR